MRFYAAGCNWKNMVVETGRVLPVRENRIEKSDADFALFVHVTRDSRDNFAGAIKKDAREITIEANR